MITAIIIDDEKPARDFLSKLIDKFFANKIMVLDSVDTIEKAVDAINKHKPELVFLDIELKAQDGFQLFKHFDSVFFDIIFTTAHQHYAINAIKHAAIDYLLKPLNYVDLNEAIKRLERKQTLTTNQQRITALLENLNTSATEFNRIALPTTTGYELEKISNIVYAEGEDNYSRIYTINNKEITISKTLKYLEEVLPSNSFVRIHKSTLVNLNYITSYSRVNGYSVTMITGKKLDVSHRSNKDFVASILNKPIE